VKNLARPRTLTVLFMAAGLFSLPRAAFTQAYDDYAQDDYADAIVIRRTIPYPNAVKRQPLTSDQLNTSTTRLIDARRGFRPYNSVGFGQRHLPTIYHEDHFGISRNEDRPFSYATRRPATGVKLFENPRRSASRTDRKLPVMVYRPMEVVDERASDTKDEPVEQKIRIHQGEAILPSNCGAVLITSDGTVIQVGD